ncbi:hypothetical protein HMPREF1531_01982 [Propionibacterium sp. oral taxon 192 str. F0372]|uniref:homoserine dehydrogenase n=1 Tax=Propionibacterium sp. oral taxon 192 TaxID=671222 RepID=UPI0003530DF2|nr:homoserine dehydrogenase [Propionibacterium sp. oral taxon 192]EPH02671.1 hypothetical protein HMPREF1531_01982 [Propionibacterium sp. oral taxon 192 str. F0372]
MNEKNVLRVGLLGAGTVGAQVARLILTQGDELEARIGRRLELIGVAVRDKNRQRPGIPAELITTDAEALLASGDLDIVIELMGGIEPARTLIMSAISHGASVVTANKALLAAEGPMIFKAAARAGVDVYYEAAVAGAIPIVRPLRESLVGDEIRSVMGIVNGTTNFILDKMATEGMDYGSALRQAQELGYAEVDPTADVEGLDAAAKATLLASLAFHTRVSSSVPTEGITAIDTDIIKAAASMGCVVKLLAVAVMLSDGRISVRVHPAMVANDHPLASVNGAYNAIFVEAASAGRLMFMGPGAGGAPTASAVVGDLVTIGRNRTRGVAGAAQSMYRELEVAPITAARTRYYLRIDVVDRPGTLAQIASVLAAHNVSIRIVQQSPDAIADGEANQIHLMTHEALESDVLDCVSELKTSPAVHGEVRFIRVEGM